MLFRRLFPCALSASLVLMMAAAAAAQTADRPRQVTVATQADGASALVNDFQIVSESEPAANVVEPATDLLSAGAVAPVGRTLRFEGLMLSAINERLGSPYVWGAAGPRVFDCSGFVWSVYRSLGVNFTRVSARTLWAQFSAPAPGERHKFGTLVFFSGLSHVGIVADEKGFYHASRSKGVVYSPFNDYWLSRVDGYRRVPLPMPLLAE